MRSQRQMIGRTVTSAASAGRARSILIRVVVASTSHLWLSYGLVEPLGALRQRTGGGVGCRSGPMWRPAAACASAELRRTVVVDCHSGTEPWRGGDRSTDTYTQYRLFAWPNQRASRWRTICLFHGTNGLLPPTPGRRSALFYAAKPQNLTRGKAPPCVNMQSGPAESESDEGGALLGGKKRTFDDFVGEAHPFLDLDHGDDGRVQQGGPAPRCLDPTHPPGCQQCALAPPVSQENFFELTGGGCTSKEGEKVTWPRRARASLGFWTFPGSRTFVTPV